MKAILFVLLIGIQLHSLEYEVKIDNDLVTVSRAKIFPKEEIGLHRDEHPQVVIALSGGTITRLEADGSTVDVAFPTHVPVFRKTDPVGQLHRSVNLTDNPIELIIIQLKGETNTANKS